MEKTNKWNIYTREDLHHLKHGDPIFILMDTDKEVGEHVIFHNTSDGMIRYTLQSRPDTGGGCSSNVMCFRVQPSMAFKSLVNKLTVI